MNRIIVIAGTDSSGGAGLSRDVAVASAFGFQVTPVVTAVTAQTDAAVLDIRPMPPDCVATQLGAALAGEDVGAVKIGMLASTETALAVADVLAGTDLPVVLDPVLISSSGKALMSGTLPKALIRRARLITPNLPEAAALTGQPPAEDQPQIAAQAALLRDRGARAVLIKGGHGTGGAATDHLFDGPAHYPFSARRLPAGKRGTGCTLATALACQLARGHDLVRACEAAKTYTFAWLSE